MFCFRSSWGKRANKWFLVEDKSERVVFAALRCISHKIGLRKFEVNTNRSSRGG